MEETATICTQATENSLVILDEIGRGTSTFDGLAIAQAVVEYLHTQVKARCLFATHYHELTLLPAQFPGMASYYAASKKTAQGILFLYKIMRGVADGSFGVEVAKLAKLPHAVVQRAQVLLEELTTVERNQMHATPTYQAALIDDEAKDARCCSPTECMQNHLKEINVDTLSPRQAFDILWKMKHPTE
jgi:DNA mismatch repair protein MutS